MTVRIIDVETTGIDPAVDKVIEIASVDLTRDFGITARRETFVFPGMPIPPLAASVHHIIDEDVIYARPLDEAIVPFRGADAYVAHNAKFEQQFLGAALGNPPFVCTYKCALRLWPELPKHTNQFLRYHFGLIEPFGVPRKDIAAHRALSDVIVTTAIFVKMMQETTWQQLLEWSREPALFTVFSFGKHMGQRYDAVPVDYLLWMINEPGMDEDKKFSARHWLEQRRRAA